MQYKKIIVRILIATCIVAGTMDLVNMKPADALRFMAALYLCIPLASLALSDISKWYLKITFVSVTIVLLLISRGHVYPLLAAAVFVGWSLYSIIRHHTLLHRRKTVTPRALAYVHSAIFCIVCSVAGTLSIMGRGNTFDITCEQVQGVVNEHIATVLKPFRFTSDQVTNITTRVDSFFTKSTDEVIQDQIIGQFEKSLGWWILETETVTAPYSQPAQPDLASILQKLKNGTMTPEQLLQDPALAKYVQAAQVQMQKQSQAPASSSNSALWAKLLNNKDISTRGLRTTSNTTTMSALSKSTPQPSSSESTSWFLGSIVWSTLGDKQDLDGKICNVVFDQIRTWSTKPWFTFSIIISLIFFFYPLARLFAYIYAGIVALIFMLLRSAGFISVTPEEKIVSTWSVWNDDGRGHDILSMLQLKHRKEKGTYGINQGSRPLLGATDIKAPWTYSSPAEPTSKGGGGWAAVDHILEWDASSEHAQIPSKKSDLWDFWWNFAKRIDR